MTLRYIALSLSLACAATAQAQQDHATHAGHDAPAQMLMWTAGEWSMMAHGFGNAVADYQGGPRGDRQRFANSMLMVMGQRPWGAGSLHAQAMLSLDPAMGPAGYPLLFQAGETADGHSHLVDRQHPHDAFMELSLRYRRPLGENAEAWIYAGLPGEPALGPETFMHRLSGQRIPEAPLTHHWLDSTHITMGVVSIGARRGPVKLEASRFNGREPDQHRWNIETRRFDSWSARATWQVAAQLSMQVSHGRLASPEGLDPDTSLKRTTASLSYRGVTVAWGRNDRSGPEGRRKNDGWLVEAAHEIAPSHTLFGRAERISTDELFDHHDALHGRTFDVAKLSVGYLYDFARAGVFTWSVGGLASAFDVPGDLKPVYGADPRAYMVFLQVRF